MKKVLAVLLCIAMLAGFAACGTKTGTDENKTYKVGVVQLVQHEALDQATQGFQDALREALGDKVAQQGYLFNSPFVVFEGESDEKPIVSLSNEGLIVDCIKPAEDGNGYIVRMYEPYGVPGKTILKVADGLRITEVSPLEEYIGECSGEIIYKPFEFRTFRVV